MRRFRQVLNHFCRWSGGRDIKILNFAIGGPYGHGQFIKQKSDKIISFGKMTWSHIIARLMLVEQIYRIESIFNNHPYHK